MNSRHTLRWRRFCLFFVALCLALAASLQAQTSYQPTKENLATREWFQNAKFGLFVHWGVYSVLADGEWVMNNKKIPISEYEKLPARFNPTEFDPAEWVALVKAAGMKYITITSKHHDGFAMWDSKVSDWNIVARTPYKKDVLKLLADECHKQGVKLFFYHSQLDWHHPDYFPRGRTGAGYTGRPESGEWFKYIDYMDAQLKELLTGYGPIAGIWFDGMWDKPQADWRLQQTYKLIHGLQPAALVGSNHHQAPIPGEDFQMFEKDLPGANTAGFNTTEIGKLPLETCETINGAWGYNANDKRFKSTKALIDYLARAAGYGANFLLNVGPMPNGKIQPEFVERLKQMGAWLDKYGESIYGTRGGPIGPRPWGVTTRKGNTVYVHILNWPDPTIALPQWPAKVKSAKFLKDGSKAEYSESDYGFLLKIPPRVVDEYDTVVALELAQ
jgi:alpha-L-fucosidase